MAVTIAPLGAATFIAGPPQHEAAARARPSELMLGTLAQPVAATARERQIALMGASATSELRTRHPLRSTGRP